MSTDRDLLVGFAGEIDAAGLADYLESGTYTAGQTAIAFNRMPADPDRVVLLSLYSNGGDYPSLPVSSPTLQVRVRGTPGAPLDANDLASDLYALLQGLTHRTYGTVHVDQCLHRSTVPLGADGNDRWEISMNFDLDVDLPTTANRPG